MLMANKLLRKVYSEAIKVDQRKKDLDQKSFIQEISEIF